YASDPYRINNDAGSNANYTQTGYQTQSDTNGQQAAWDYASYGSDAPKTTTKKSSGMGSKLGKAVALGLAFGLAGGVAFTGVSQVSNRLTANTAQEEIAKPQETTPAASSDAGSNTIGNTAVSNATTVNDVSDIAQNVMPSIVQVSVMTVTEYRNWFGQVGEYESEGAGSGIIIDQDDDYLYIATNNHVVSGAKELTITFNNDEAVEAEILGTDSRTDLAVVKVKLKDIPKETMDHIKVATVGSSENLEVGSSVVVIGNALGYGQSVTTGVISALERDVELMSDDGTPISNRLIQTDAAVNPGNSGGALLNMNGEVIGVVSAKYADTEVEGMGYAIPISDASEIITGLIKGEDVSAAAKGNGAYLGIAGVDVNEQTARQYNMPTGVYVSQAVEGKGAEAAGIQKGDVITKFNEKKISSMRDIQDALAECMPGDTVKITIQREGIMGYTEMEADVELSTAPEDKE
ncbi:MAG: trypsin-like peptidase domain-containing protein, partial [Lachnospiraceae bacterium]|nr:trypsin-like peptidase domain-containing protein [Lachnospiraceae bacterium]